MAKQAVEQLFRQTDVDVVGNLGGRAVADIDQRMDFLLHGILRAKVVQGNLDHIQHQPEGHGNEDRVSSQSIGKPLFEAVAHGFALSLLTGLSQRPVRYLQSS